MNYAVLGNLRTNLPSGLTGKFWITGNTTKEAAATLQNCSYLSVATGQEFALVSAPCRDILDGFLCNYAFTDPCQALQAGEGARVTYTSHMGFQVDPTPTIPPGTVAVMGKVGAEHPDSKYLCSGKDWERAPWSCEVLGGGCENDCNSTTGRCTCPARHYLLSNKISCTADPCARCAPLCKREGDSCKCAEGYRLAGNGDACVDVDECKEKDPCTGDGKKCVNTQGDFKCGCQEGFELEDGVCMDISICIKCEHMMCEKPNGVYECVCKPGYKVSPWDPTRCEMDCFERDCPAVCILKRQNPDKTEPQCYCPKGYILNQVNGTNMCSDMNECEGSQCHRCENLYGSFRCSCNQGFRVYKGYKCVPIKEGTSSPPPYPTVAGVQPGAVPSYVKAGSVLGIAVFLVLAAVLLFFLLHNVAKRCSTFQLDSLKHSNIDNIVYLQQVTTETYKRLSPEKHFKNDSQVP